MTENQHITRDMFLNAWDQAKAAANTFVNHQPGLLTHAGLTARQMGPAYKVAYQAFQAEDYANAENLFLSLFLMDMQEKSFQTGLAASLEAQEKFDRAFLVYSLALALEKEKNPRLMFRMGKCLMAMEQYQQARVIFETAALCSPRNVPELRAVERSKKMLALIKV